MTAAEVEVVVDEEAVRALPAVVEHEAMIARAEISPDEVVAQREKIKQVMERVMRDGTHYGTIPGVNKPSLFKPGAEVLLVTFRLAPEYQSDKTFHGDGHLTVTSKCVLRHIPTGLFLGEGEGLCTTMESRYAYRVGVRVCPNCGADAIKKSKFKPKEGDYTGATADDPPGWYCYAKVGGCGMNFHADDHKITEQETGRTANPDLPDAWNTVLKMAAKRALVAAILNATAASDIFTQDVEDSPAARASETPQEDAGGAVRIPRGWQEWSERMTALGVPEHDQKVWLEDAAGLDRKWDRARRLLVLLTEKDGVDFRTDERAVIQECIAEAFDGLAAAGPPWRVGVNENHLPTYEEWQENVRDEELARAAQSGSMVDTLGIGGEAVPDEDIPFGSD